MTKVQFENGTKILGMDLRRKKCIDDLEISGAILED